jgi:hypothetical protein
VGIGTSNPSNTLDVVGTAEVDGFKLPTNAANNYVLTSDATGTGTWQPGGRNLVDYHNEVATVPIGSSVTQYDDAQVSITAPGPGYIVVTSNVWLKLSHTSGTVDDFSLSHTDNASALGAFTDQVREEIPSGYATDTEMNRTFSVHSTFPVASAGTYTYYLVGQMHSGQDAGDKFWYAQMTAIYYPDPSVSKIRLETEKKAEGDKG